MGVLDDAIRQHLELKRKHGVPEEELERQEEEALGPARRELAAAEAAEPGAGDGDGELPDQAAPEAAASEQVPAEGPAAGAEEEPHFEEAVAGEPAYEEGALAEEPVTGESAYEEEALPDEGAARESAYEEEQPHDEPATGEPASPETEARLEPRAEHGLEEGALDPDARPLEPRLRSGETPVHGFPALEDDDEPEGDLDEAESEDGESREEPEGDGDVLEDTPDFLQETPEHDRLWFEQKPPRDFDFD